MKEEGERIRNMVTDVVGSYEHRISAVGEIIESSLAMLDQCHHVEQAVQSRLRETLSEVESLRKKDFDSLIAPILAYQGKREQDIKQLLHAFLKKQREIAGQLKRMIQAEILFELPTVEKTIQSTIEEAKERLVCFQKEQSLIGEKMQYLFRKKEAITLNEFKKTLDTLQAELGLNKDSNTNCTKRNENEKNAMFDHYVPLRGS